MIIRYALPLLIVISASTGFYFMSQSDPNPRRSNTESPKAEISSQKPEKKPNLTEQLSEEEQTKLKTMTAEERAAFFAQQKSQSNGKQNSEKAAPKTSRPRRGGFGGRGGQFGRTTAATVSVMKVNSDNWAPQLNLFGNIVSFQQLEISSNINSDILIVNASAGDRVKKGQLLIQVDDSDLLISQRQSESRLANIDARIRLQKLQRKSDRNNLKIEKKLLGISQKSLARYENLSSQQLSSSTDYENALRSYQNQLMVVQNREISLERYDDTMAQLLAQRNELLASRDSIKNQISDTRIEAPFTGVIANINATEGQRVATNTPLLTLYDENNLGFETRIPVKWLPSLVNSTDIIFASGKLQNQHHNLELTELDSAAKQGSVKALFRFLNPPTSALGQHFSITANLPTINGIYAIPANMLYENRLVFTVEKGRLQGIEVEILGQMQIDRQSWYLISGDKLVNGILLLSTRLPNASNGLRVNVAEDGRNPL